jgi:hypothetical protein
MDPRSRRPSRHRAPVALLAALALTVILAACGEAGSAFENVGENLDGGGAPSAGASSAPQPGNGGGTGDGQPPPFAELADRKIIKTGEITLEVESVGTAVGEVRALALSLGGYVGGSRAGDDGEAATLTLRIPADGFDETLERLRELGELRAEATREEDVTSSIVDLEARIQNLEASEAQYRSLVERAELVEDILAVQSRLDTVRGEIEQLKAQLTQLDGLATLSTLTVTLVPHTTPVETTAEGWDPQGTFDEALAALVGFGQGAADLLIWLAIVGLPLAVVLGIVAVAVMRLYPGARRREPLPPAEPASD